jgi:hypothetical protein
VTTGEGRCETPLLLLHQNSLLFTPPEFIRAVRPVGRLTHLNRPPLCCIAVHSVTSARTTRLFPPAWQDAIRIHPGVYQPAPTALGHHWRKCQCRVTEGCCARARR